MNRCTQDTQHCLLTIFQPRSSSIHRIWTNLKLHSEKHWGGGRPPRPPLAAPLCLHRAQVCINVNKKIEQRLSPKLSFQTISRSTMVPNTAQCCYCVREESNRQRLVDNTRQDKFSKRSWDGWWHERSPKEEMFGDGRKKWGRSLNNDEHK